MTLPAYLLLWAALSLLPEHFSFLMSILYLCISTLEKQHVYYKKI